MPSQATERIVGWLGLKGRMMFWRVFWSKAFAVAVLALATLAFARTEGLVTTAGWLDAVVGAFQSVTRQLTTIVTHLIPVEGIEITPLESDVLWLNGMIFLPCALQNGLAAARTGAPHRVVWGIVSAAAAVGFAATAAGVAIEDVSAAFSRFSLWDFAALVTGFIAISTGAAYHASGGRPTAPLIFLSQYVAAALLIWSLYLTGLWI